MKHKGRKKARRLDRKDALRLWRGEARDSKERRLYFGYGSNLHIAQMKRRCADSVPVVAGALPGKVLSFSNVLTIEDAPESSVIGAIYEVSAKDERCLDRYEGFPRTYSKRYTRMTLNGERRDVFYYVLNKPYTLYTPTARYYSIVEDGYLDWGLDLRHLELSYQRALDAEREAEKAYAASQKRASRKRSKAALAGWQQTTNSAYRMLSDGTIDYLDFSQHALDEEWRDALRADMEESFQSDFKRARGWCRPRARLVKCFTCCIRLDFCHTLCYTVLVSDRKEPYGHRTFRCGHRVRCVVGTCHHGAMTPLMWAGLRSRPFFFSLTLVQHCAIIERSVSRGKGLRYGDEVAGT